VIQCNHDVMWLITLISDIPWLWSCHEWWSFSLGVGWGANNNSLWKRSSLL